MQAAFDQHVNVNARDSQGRTALMLAAAIGQVNAVKELLAHHANPNIANANGVTPLRAAITNGQSRIVVILRQAGAR